MPIFDGSKNGCFVRRANKGKWRTVKNPPYGYAKNCGYKLSADEFEDDYVFWFCDECNTYLNNQETFDKKATKHICRKCGYENDTTFDNVKGICSDCGKILPDADSTLCVDCKLVRKEKAKEWLKVAGLIAIGIGTAIIADAVSDDNESDKTDDYVECLDNGDDDDEVYGLGPGLFPHCKTCGAEMTRFDGWAWYTCPVCEDKVRIIEGKETWYNEIFGRGKKQHHSDFILADFCRGGDLTED